LARAAALAVKAWQGQADQREMTTAEIGTKSSEGRITCEPRHVTGIACCAGEYWSANR
jgi:hypothetical protein